MSSSKLTSILKASGWLILAIIFFYDAIMSLWENRPVFSIVFKFSVAFLIAAYVAISIFMLAKKGGHSYELVYKAYYGLAVVSFILFALVLVMIILSSECFTISYLIPMLLGLAAVNFAQKAKLEYFKSKSDKQ